MMNFFLYGFTFLSLFKPLKILIRTGLESSEGRITPAILENNAKPSASLVGASGGAFCSAYSGIICNDTPKGYPISKLRQYKLENAWNPIYKKGFFGLIGSKNIEKTKKQSIIEAFTQEGIIQGVFFDWHLNGTQIIHPVKHEIQTDSYKFLQTMDMKIPMNLFSIFIINIIKWFSNNHINLLGKANTALFIDVHNKLWALFERDLPYEIIYDLDNQTISTGKRIWIENVQHVSGHAKKRWDPATCTTIIDTIDYDICKKKIIYNVLSGDFKQVLRTFEYSSNYIPFIHDFSLIQKNESKLFWVDSPFTFYHTSTDNLKFPIGLQKNEPTIFHVGEDIYIYPSGICIFHIAHTQETDNYIDIYTSIYENIHFAEDIKNIRGTYCCIRLIKKGEKKGNVKIYKNNDLKQYNLDFPVILETKKINSIKNQRKLVILRNIDYETNKMNGFIICHGLKIIKEFFLEKDISVLGEPVLTDTPFSKILLFFAKNDETNTTYLMKWDLYNNEIDKLPLDISFELGFHSIWIE